MRRVVIIGSDFSPGSLPPAVRIRLFARHLPKFGWRPVVLTVRPEYYEWTVDPENDRLLPESLEVIRTKALPARWTRRVGFGDIGIRSLWHHWRALKRLCRSGGVDAILIPVPPYVPMVLGRLAYERFRIPYVIDYIDPWVSDYYWTLPRTQRLPKWALAYWLSRVLEPFAVRRVHHVVGVSRGTVGGVLSRYPWLRVEDASEIPYGGEPADLEYLRTHPRRARVFDPGDGRIHVSYVGACLPAMYGPLRALFAAVRKGRERDPEAYARLRLHFVGTTYAIDAAGRYQVLPLAREAGVVDLVDEHPERIAFLDALQTLLDSHALVLVGSDQAHYTASKVFPYVLARRPLLAILHEASSAVTVLRETRAGRVVTFGSDGPPESRVDALVAGLDELLAFPSGYEPPVRWEAFEPYTACATARRLAEALERALVRDRAPSSTHPLGTEAARA